MKPTQFYSKDGRPQKCEAKYRKNERKNIEKKETKLLLNIVQAY